MTALSTATCQGSGRTGWMVLNLQGKTATELSKWVGSR